MNPPGHPKGEYRSAQHEGCLMSRRAAIVHRPMAFVRRQTVRRDCLCPASVPKANTAVRSTEVLQ